MEWVGIGPEYSVHLGDAWLSRCDELGKVFDESKFARGGGVCGRQGTTDCAVDIRRRAEDVA